MRAPGATGRRAGSCPRVGGPGSSRCTPPYRPEPSSQARSVIARQFTCARQRTKAGPGRLKGARTQPFSTRYCRLRMPGSVLIPRERPARTGELGVSSTGVLSASTAPRRRPRRVRRATTGPRGDHRRYVRRNAKPALRPRTCRPRFLPPVSIPCRTGYPLSPARRTHTGCSPAHAGCVEFGPPPRRQPASTAAGVGHEQARPDRGLRPVRLGELNELRAGNGLEAALTGVEPAGGITCGSLQIPEKIIDPSVAFVPPRAPLFKEHDPPYLLRGETAVVQGENLLAPGDRALTPDLGHTRHWILRV